METTADKQGLTVLFAARDHVLREFFAVHENPSNGGGGSIGVELAGAVLGFLGPPLQSPSMRFFLPCTKREYEER